MTIECDYESVQTDDKALDASDSDAVRDAVPYCY